MAKILIVDDNLLACEAISLVLESAGHTVRQTHRVAEALEMTRAAPPDLAILDLSLPDGNGLDLVRDLEALAADLPVILYSGYFSTDGESEKKLTETPGIVAVFRKPLRNAELLSTIAQVLPSTR